MVILYPNHKSTAACLVRHAYSNELNQAGSLADV